MSTISFTGKAVGCWRMLPAILIPVLLVGIFLCNSRTANAQDGHGIADHISAGEIPIAIDAANKLPMNQRDQWLSEIARSQMNSGAAGGAFYTAQQIQNDDSRSGLLGDFHDQRFGNLGNFNNVPLGNGGLNPNPRGGITEADFNDLVNLIRNTIEPDSWDDAQGLGSLQPYPAGVFVSADGTLKRISIDRSKTANRLKNRAVRDSGNRNATLPSDLRMVSLTRLERAAQLAMARGDKLNEMMHNMAGIYEIKFVTVFPESGDVVIAGPAGDWEMNDQGRPVNVDTGKPVLQLDDLVVCLRNAKSESGKFGCSINPRHQNLVATKKFLETNKLKGKKWAEGLRTALGQQDIEVFGIDPDTHAARVLVEADYRMKLIGMGLEESIPEVPSYFKRLTDNQRNTASDVVRWWFTMNYDDVVSDEARTVFSFEGTGVKVLSETEFLNQQGQRVHTGKSNAETSGFAKDFTKHFEKLSDKYPVYRQLKNLFDLALVAGIIDQQKLDDRVNWKQAFFVGNEDDSFRYQVRRDVSAKQVDSVMNQQVIKRRKQRSTVTQTIVGVSGGITFDAAAVISAPLVDDEGQLSEQQTLAIPEADETLWWWD
ncbi:MAG: DUF1598 domain-containing protein [Planctomycetota bacterium]